MATITTRTSSLPSPSTDPDLELSPVSLAVSDPQSTAIADPYSLQAKLIPPDQLSTLRRRGTRRKIRQFYEDQNANIERLLKSVDDHCLAAASSHKEKQLKVGWACVARGKTSVAKGSLKLPCGEVL